MAFLNYDGLKRYDKKTKEYIEDKIKNIKDIDVDKLATKDELNTKANKDELFSGDYNDLKNLPVIPDTTNLASKSDLSTHTDNNTIHVTSTEKNTWNNKLDNSALTNYATQSYVTNEINKATSGITVDLTPYAKKVDVNTKLDTKVDKVVGKSLVDDAEIARLATINNYNDTDIKTSIANINSKLDTKANKSELFSKSYNDLTDKPTIPSLTGYAKLTDIPDITGKADKTYVDTKLDTKANKSELFSKSYNDLTDKPTIPSLDGYLVKVVFQIFHRSSLARWICQTGLYKLAEHIIVNTIETNPVKRAVQYQVASVEKDVADIGQNTADFFSLTVTRLTLLTI